MRHISEHLQVDIAHTIMLAEQQILTENQATDTLKALKEASELGASFPTDPRFDSLLLQVEQFIKSRVGTDVGGRMHTGRSRIDHNAAVWRLSARNELLDAHERLVGFIGNLTERAREYGTVVMPGWTHLQHAQPWTLGHYLLRHAYLFERYAQRVEECYRRTNLSSLGGAALVGTSWPVNRERVASLLAHDGIVRNSHDAGEFTLDWINELASLYARLMVDVGRIAGDLYLWHSWEFGLIDVADEYCGTSSIMPQKKNPMALEFVRGQAGLAVSWPVATMGLSRSASSTDCDPAFVKSVLPEASSTFCNCVDLLSEILSTMEVHEDVMSARAGAYWSTASGLADALVERFDVPFRTAHQVVAQVVRECVDGDVEPGMVNGDIVGQAFSEVTGRDVGVETSWVQECLDPQSFLSTRRSSGNPRVDDIENQLGEVEGLLDQHLGWHRARGEEIAAARREREEVLAYYLRDA